MSLFYVNAKFKSVYQRLIDANHTAKLYYYDQVSSSLEVINLLKDQPKLFGTYQQFLDDCERGTLPQYSFVEPNYSDHLASNGGQLIASDQHPDHNILEGERFIASIYMAIRSNPDLWRSTALLVTYDEHGGIYDHVPPPACTPDTPFVAQPKDTRIGKPFMFDRLGVRVPAILVSPWVAKGAINNDVFEHASIPATAMKWLLPSFDNTQRSAREAAAPTFLDLLTDTMRTDAPEFA
jgi:phospholipase C